MKMNTTTIVDLIRHGEPVGGRRYRGQSDDPLSEKGWRQMWQAMGDEPRWDQIVSSPLQRCRAFAEVLSHKHDIPCVLDERFRELGYGVWEGSTPEELTCDDPERLLRYFLDPVAYAPEGAEPLQDFQRRVSQAWKELLIVHAGKRVLVVCHAGVIRAVIAHVLETPYTTLFRIAVDNAGITRFRKEDGRAPVLMFHGGSFA